MNKNGRKYRIIRENKNEFSVHSNSLRLYLAHKSRFLSRKFFLKDTSSGSELMRSVRTAAGNWLITCDDTTHTLSMRLDQWSQWVFSYVIVFSAQSNQALLFRYPGWEMSHEDK